MQGSGDVILDWIGQQQSGLSVLSWQGVDCRRFDLPQLHTPLPDSWRPSDSSRTRLGVSSASAVCLARVGALRSPPHSHPHVPSPIESVILSCSE